MASTSLPRTIARIALGGILLIAGTTHLTVARQEFQAQVPEWLPLNDDLVVFGSGIVELSLGAALVALPKHRVKVGLAAAAFFIAIFPGNISQYLTHTNAFGLNTDTARGTRLLFQPLLVLWSLWSTAAWRDRRQALSKQ